MTLIQSDGNDVSPEKHLAAILAAFTSSQNLGMDSELYEALMRAEQDFDGVEES